MTVPALHTPAEVLDISPENLDVANTYLQTQSIQQTANILDVATDMVSQILSRREVRAYIDNVFMDIGFNNRFRMRSAMDALIQKKFQELEEAEVGSGKDIADLLALSHKMSMDVLDRQLQLEKLKEANLKSQVNVQLNDFGSGSKYNTLLEKLMKGEV